MAKLSVRHLAQIKQSDPKMGDALTDIINGVSTVSTATSVNPNGGSLVPQQPSALNVVAADGIYHAQIHAPTNEVQGTKYYLEYDTDPNFTSPHVIDNGASRTYRGTLGNQTLHWRSYTQLPGNSPPSAPVVFGGSQKPTPVVGGGVSGPPLLDSTGSGTASNNGQQGGSGAGKTPFRSDTGTQPILSTT